MQRGRRLKRWKRGILAAMRTDVSTLTPEQQTALSGIIAGGRRAKVDDPKAARQDLDFLLDCLEMDTPDIKAAALRELATVLGKPVAFDLTQKDRNLRRRSTPCARKSWGMPRRQSRRSDRRSGAGSGCASCRSVGDRGSRASTEPSDFVAGF